MALPTSPTTRGVFRAGLVAMVLSLCRADTRAPCAYYIHTASVARTRPYRVTPVTSETENDLRSDDARHATTTTRSTPEAAASTHEAPSGDGRPSALVAHAGNHDGRKISGTSPRDTLAAPRDSAVTPLARPRVSPPNQPAPKGETAEATTGASSSRAASSQDTRPCAGVCVVCHKYRAKPPS